MFKAPEWSDLHGWSIQKLFVPEHTKYHDTTIHSTEVLFLNCKFHPDIAKKNRKRCRLLYGNDNANRKQKTIVLFVYISAYKLVDPFETGRIEIAGTLQFSINSKGQKYSQHKSEDMKSSSTSETEGPTLPIEIRLNKQLQRWQRVKPQSLRAESIKMVKTISRSNVTNLLTG
jgi:hypothetical protein